MHRAIADRIHIVGPGRKRHVVTRQRVVEMPQKPESIGAIEMCLRKLRCKGNRAIQALNGFLVTSQFIENISAIAMGFGN